MNAQEMWALFSQEEHIFDTYEAWAFGADPDKLARLVCNGTKTGTSSLHLFYRLENQELPKEGEYSVILDSKEHAVCVIKTTKVYVVPFCEVSEAHAYKEGEGNRTLSYWRKIHEEFFSEELKTVGMTFNTNIQVVCEEFTMVFSA